MFNNCSSLILLPDISKWDTRNIINMNYLFSECTSLTKLPDISIWKTENLIYMENIFYNCSPILLPDISNWNIIKIKNIKDIFSSDSNYNSVKIINNSELSINLQSPNLTSNYSSDNKNERETVSYENYKIKEVDFSNQLKDINDYYENFYK